MNDFLDFILTEKNMIFLILPILIASLIQVVTRVLRDVQRAKTSGPEKFFKVLDKKFDLDLVKDRNDIIMLLDSIGREFDTEYSLAPLLQDYLKYLTSEKASEADENGVKKIQRRYEFVKKVVEEELKEKPFANVPEEERRLLRSFKDAIAHNDNQALNFHLDELSALISQRHRIYARTNRINRWSLPLAFIAIITTVIFGYMSISRP